jgi:predicted CoA-binding protein
MAIAGPLAAERRSGGIEVTLWRWVDKVVIVLVGLVVAVDGLMILSAQWAVVHRSHKTDSLYRDGASTSVIPPPAGFSAKGEQVVITPAQQKGWAVRYYAKDCHFCQQDEKQWGQVASELRRLGYRIIALSPESKQLGPDASQASIGAQQAAYVSMEWIRRLRLNATPTLLIFGPDQRMIWAQEGTLNWADRQSLVRTIEAAGKPST